MIKHDLYTELVLQHYKTPLYKGNFDGEPHYVGEGTNPNCGDLVVIFIGTSKDGNIDSIKWEGKGCALCMASSSMMAEWANKEKPTIKQAIIRAKKVRSFLRGESDGCDLGKYKTFSSICKHPSRVKCASLPWSALEAAVS